MPFASRLVLRLDGGSYDHADDGVVGVGYPGEIRDRDGVGE